MTTKKAKQLHRQTEPNKANAKCKVQSAKSKSKCKVQSAGFFAAPRMTSKGQKAKAKAKGKAKAGPPPFGEDDS
jgi:hypothetical protein